MQTTTRAPVTSPFAARVGAARHSLLTFGQLSPDEFAARRRERLLALLAHHYYNPFNDTYRRTLQRHGLDWGEPQRHGTGVFGRVFSRHSTTPLPQRIPVPDDMPESAILAMLPIVDKQLLLDGNYREKPCVPPDQIAYHPASSGTTSGTRGYTALSRRSAWSFGSDTSLWQVMLAGINPATTYGYPVAHFKRGDIDDAESSGTYVSANELCKSAPDLLTLGCTQDPIDQHVAQLLQKPTRWSFCSPHFYRQLVIRAGERDLRHSALELIFWGGAAQTEDDYHLVMEKLGLRHSLGVYGVGECGVAAIQLWDRGPYGVVADRHIFEIVDDAGQAVKPGETGNVLLTSLLHDGTPIIRYRIGDTARFLGQLGTDGQVWQDLAIHRPTPTWSDESYLEAGIIRQSAFFDQLARTGGLIIGDGKVSYEDVFTMQMAMAQKGTPVSVFQVVKRFAPDGRHEVVVRVEANPEQDARVRDNANAALRLSNQLDYLFADGELPPPVIEIFAPGELTAGAFKVPPLIDETLKVAPTS